MWKASSTNVLTQLVAVSNGHSGVVLDGTSSNNIFSQSTLASNLTAGVYV
jgi:hypothetical protein